MIGTTGLSIYNEHVTELAAKVIGIPLLPFLFESVYKVSYVTR